MEAQASGRALPRAGRAISENALKRRLISAAVGLPVTLIAVLAGVPTTTALASAAALVAGYEIANVCRAVGFARAAILLSPVAMVLVGLYLAAENSRWATIWASVTAVLVVVALPKRPGGASVAFLSVATAIYVGVSLAHAPVLRSSTDGARWLLLAIVATFAVDSAAYFTGRAIGRHKMAPYISPGKTWEGTAGGLFAGVVAGVVLSYLLSLKADPWQAVLLGLAIGVTAVLGDLAESWFKRRGGVKDAGGLIPGHGGMLDRLDSLAPNLAVVYYASLWIGG